MSDRLNTDLLRQALTSKGWQQVDLAIALGVTEAAVSQWFGGSTVPRPATLLRMSMLLDVPIERLQVSDEPALEPIVAYRRKGQQRTTAFREEEAYDQAIVLDSVSDFLPKRNLAPPTAARIGASYVCAEDSAKHMLERLGHAADKPLTWTQIVRWFIEWEVVLVPVFWGEREHHGNALHIHLPRLDQTFVFVNLDSEQLDFKFWLAHELGHLLAPKIAGEDEGEDFSDLFAGSLLFPAEQAAAAYREARGARTPAEAIGVLTNWAQAWEVSLFTVLMQCNQLAKSRSVPPLLLPDAQVHAARRKLDRTLPSIRAELLSSGVTSVGDYVVMASERFRTPFFDALAAYLKATGAGPTFVRRAMHIPLGDAITLHSYLLES